MPCASRWKRAARPSWQAGCRAAKWRCRPRPPRGCWIKEATLARETAGEAAAGFVNQALRKLARSGSGERGAVPSHPSWLVQRWATHFGADETAQLVAWNDARPRLTLQPARWDPEMLARLLREAGFGVTKAPFGAGLQVSSGGTAPRSPLPRRLPGFAEGAFIVQDPAHALVCRYAAVPWGALVYDACAAPGGKSVTLERLGARVVAGDARRDRLARHGGFGGEPGRRAVAAELLPADGDFPSLPQRHGVDGAFAARLRRSH